MNDRLLSIALKNNVLNCVDNESPPHYFVHANCEVEDVENCMKEVIQQCLSQIAMIGVTNFENDDVSWTVEVAIKNIENTFGLK